MNTEVQLEIDWLGWLRCWDVQQERYVPEREARFAAIRAAAAAARIVRGVGPRLRAGFDQSAATRPLPQRASDPGGHRSGDAGHRMGAWSARSTAACAGSTPIWASPDWLEALGETQMRRGAPYHRAPLA